MDKKNTLLGILCILAGIGFMMKQNADVRKQQLEDRERERLVEKTQQTDQTNKDIGIPLISESSDISVSEIAENALDVPAEPVDSVA